MPEIKVALIGYGRSGRDIHAQIIRDMPGQFRVVAAAELDEARREMQRRELGCDVYADYREFYGRNDIDLVVNASFSHMHVPIAVDLLEHGFNVLTEKPMAHTKGQAERMMAAEGASGKRLMIFQQSRYAPYFAKVREVIDSGKLGRIAQISLHFSNFARRWDWQCLQDMGGGNLYNTGPHPVDQALWLLGGEGLPNMTAFMDRANSSGDAEDYVKIVMSLPGRPVVDVEISSCNAYPLYTYHVQGTRGGLMGSMNHLDWRYWIDAENPPQPLQRETLRYEDDTPRYCGEKLLWHEESWEPQGEEANMFLYMGKKYYGMLHRVLTQGAAPEVTLGQIARQIAVMQEAHRQCGFSYAKLAKGEE